MQTISFAPYFISTVVVVGILNQIFSYRYGVVNGVLNLLGQESVNFLGMRGFFRPAYVLSGVWQGAGYGSVLYIAALSSVDLSLYEAAALDGASRLQRVIYVDLPCIAPTIIISLIMNTGSILSVGFEKVFLMQNPVNYGVSEIISTYVSKNISYKDLTQTLIKIKAGKMDGEWVVCPIKKSVQRLCGKMQFNPNDLTELKL